MKLNMNAAKINMSPVNLNTCIKEEESAREEEEEEEDVHCQKKKEKKNKNKNKRPPSCYSPYCCIASRLNGKSG